MEINASLLNVIWNQRLVILLSHMLSTNIAYHRIDCEFIDQVLRKYLIIGRWLWVAANLSLANGQ